MKHFLFGFEGHLKKIMYIYWYLNTEWTSWKVAQ